MVDVDAEDDDFVTVLRALAIGFVGDRLVESFAGFGDFGDLLAEPLGKALRGLSGGLCMSTIIEACFLVWRSVRRIFLRVQTLRNFRYFSLGT